MKVKVMVAAMFFLLSFMVTGYAQEMNEKERFDIVVKDVEQIIGNHIYYTVYDIISVKAEDNVITLSGKVTAPYKRASIISSIEKRLPEGVQLVSEIETLSPSANDQRIRYLLARKIYNDSRLLRYSLAKYPYPVHIIVDNGHVTLVGEVGTKMDKRLIESKVRDVFGIVSVKNNLSVS